MRKGGCGRANLASAYALDMVDSMADSESDLETDGLELALDTLCKRHCSDGSAPRSKSYCSEFCEVSFKIFDDPNTRCVFNAIASNVR